MPLVGADNRRELSLGGWLAILVGYLVVLKGVGLLVASGIGGLGDLTTDEDVLRALVIPIGASFAYAVAVVSWLGWWHPVLFDDRPVQRWVLVVPAVFVIVSFCALDYGALGGRPVGFVALLVLGFLLVGITEELMFRGTGVEVLRAQGWDERRVALWSSVVFGAVHLSNAVVSGGGAVAQAITVSFAGYFLYLTRRVTGALFAGAAIHALFDFSISSGVLDDTAYAPGGLAVLAYLVAGVVVFARRHHIEPA